MHILHINLAKGFRGGERQTALLIQGLANQYPQLQQSIIVRRNSPLIPYLSGVNRLTIITAAQPLITGLFLIKAADIIHAHEAKACHLAHWLSKRIKCPYIITRRIDRKPKNNWFTRRVYRDCNQVVSLSSAIKQIMQDAYPKLHHSIIPSMNASLPYSAQAVGSIRQAHPEKFIIGHIGALVSKHKGQQYIIEAAEILAKSHPNLHFLLVGEGRDSEQLKQSAVGLDNITFVGFKDNVGDYYRAFDVFLFPSLEEGLGSSLLDAMEAGLPIIASNAGGIPDIIRDKENGLLIPPRNANAIVNAIMTLVSDKTLASTLAEQAHSEIERFSPMVISNSYMDIYQTLTGIRP